MAFEARITFNMPESESYEIDPADWPSYLGVNDETLKELKELSEGVIQFEDGGAGRGAQGPGFSIIIGLSDNIVSTTAGLIVVGEAIRRFFQKFKNHSTSGPVVTESRTLAAIAAASAEGLAGEIRNLKFIECRTLANSEEQNPSDERDVWSVYFESESEGYALVVYVSPQGFILGRTRIPYRLYFNGSEWIDRTERDIIDFHQRWQR